MSDDNKDEPQDEVPEKYRQVRLSVAEAGIVPGQPARCLDRRNRRSVFGTNGDGLALNVWPDPFK